MTQTPRRVAYVFPISHRFRASFHERLRSILADSAIEYDFVHTDIDRGGKGDTIRILWGTQTGQISIPVADTHLIYQSAFTKVLDRDLIIVQQENLLLLNYPLIIARRLLGRPIAFFGHGKNFQSSNPESLGERFKRFWINKVDWWFAYTQRSADIVAQTGFPSERITVFNNAIDTAAIQTELDGISEAEKDAERVARFAGSRNIGVYIGGLYDLKRIDHLIESAILVRQRVPDFQLMIIGGGPDAPLAKAAAERHPWIHALGPRFGREKTLLASLGKVFLMPGLVGLGVLDSFAYGIPMVTTDLPYHSPEIDYLQDGVNGVMVRETDSREAYASAVERVLRDDVWRDRLRVGAAEALQTYTIDAMAERFAEGVIKALSLKRPRKTEAQNVIPALSS